MMQIGTFVVTEQLNALKRFPFLIVPLEKRLNLGNLELVYGKIVSMLMGAITHTTLNTLAKLA